MPGMNGLQLLRSIRALEQAHETPRRCKACIVSGSWTGVDPTPEFAAAGGDYFLGKPFTPAEVGRLVKNLSEESHGA